MQNQGHYSYTFEYGGKALGNLTGEDLITPVDHASGGLTLVTSGKQVDYVFPVDLALDPALTKTIKVVMTVNTYMNFRWQDQTADGYAAGVFDTTATTYEPVMSYGANAFSIGVE